MIELSQHIERLLLENDCVIVPKFGGFITHYMPAVWLDGEGIFLPPTRSMGFNQQLKMNDGLLVQSYMEAYDTNFSDAAKILEKEVEELINTLHESGCVDLPNIGEIRFSLQDSYIFSPYDNKVSSPSLYGLDSFEMKALETLRISATKKIVISEKVNSPKTREFKINYAILRNAVAVIAAIVVFFSMSTPLENTYVEKVNYAQLLPSDLFSQIESKSLITSPVVVSQPGNKESTNKKTTTTAVRKKIKPVAVKEVKVPAAAVEKKATTSTVANQPEVSKEIPKKHPYHIIVASVAQHKDAESMVEDLKAKGYSDAQVVIGDGKIRVSIQSFLSREEVAQPLSQLRQNENYKNAWMLAQ